MSEISNNSLVRDIKYIIRPEEVFTTINKNELSGFHQCVDIQWRLVDIKYERCINSS